MILAASGGALTLYAIRARVIEPGPPFAAVSREGAILANNLLLLVATGTVFLGTFYPLLIDALTNDKISVGPPYFDMTFAPIMLVVAGLMAFGPLLRWRSDEPRPATQLLTVPAIAGLSIGVVAGIFGNSLWGGLGFAFASFVVLSLARWLQARMRLGKAPLRQSLTMARAFPGATWGFLGAHLGFAVAMFGVTAMSVWNSEDVALLKRGETMQLGSYALRLETVETVPGPNYEAQRLTFSVLHNGRADGSISTERRYYPERDTVTTEAGIRPGVFENLYVAAGEEVPTGGFNVRINHHPLAMWIWIGGFMIAGGGFVSLSDRRFRIGAPHRTRAALAAASA
jgi:cytochrome c-type biogenesis protein CcmF